MTRTRLLLISILAGMLNACSEDSSPLSNIPAVAAPPPEITLSNSPTASEPLVSQLTTTPVADLPQCTKYKATAVIQGKSQALDGEACRQPDGTWTIAEQPVGAQYVYQTVYVPPPDAAEWYGPCFYGAYESPCSLYVPFGFSIGFPVFVDVHRHFHRFVPVNIERFHSFHPLRHVGDIGTFERHFGFHNSRAFRARREQFHAGGPPVIFHHVR